MYQTTQILINSEHEGQRLDSFLSDCQDLGISRARAQQLIKDSLVLLNDKPVKTSYKLKSGDKLVINIPEAKNLDLKAENISLDIVYEDDQLIVVNKQAGLVTHPAPGAYSGTLVNALLHHMEQSSGTLSGINGVLRPGIVHRLDKDTSGLIIVAKTDKAHRSLAEQIQKRSLERRYLALVHGSIREDQGSIDKAIARHPVRRKIMAVISSPRSRSARTHWSVKQRFNTYTLVECKLDTGRTHQIRVHMSWFKHPIVGDYNYGAPKKNPFKVERPLLHSYRMIFTHPVSGASISLESPLPKDFQQVVQILQKDK
jgi:23S rRNA pseudouridine1911/1915/1917 synthase